MSGKSDTSIKRRTYGVKLVRGPVVKLEPHEAACETEDELLALAAASGRPLAADLFCGAGGMSMGLTECGFDVVLAVDHDDEALETHRSNHPGLSVNWDLADPSVVERVARLVTDCGITLVAGGPPCQPFSKAGRSMLRELVRTGRREAHDHRRDLWESFLGVIELARPAAVLMENVPDMALDRGMFILRTMIARLERLGYSVEERVIDTWRYGVPQFRQRLILVALADECSFSWPDETGRRVTVQNAIGDLPNVTGGWRPSNGRDADPVASGWADYGTPRSAFQRRARSDVVARDIHRVYDHITRPVREDDALAFASMDSTTKYSDLAPELKRYRDDVFDDKYKRLDWNDVSRTITAHIAKDGYWYIHPEQDRTLTVREAARLQTFRDDVRFSGPPSAAFRQIGNAVPPLLAFHIGTAIQNSLAQRRLETVPTRLIAEELADWLRDNPPIAVPWLRARNRWEVLQAEILWARVAQPHVVWEAMRALDLRTPSRTSAGIDQLKLLARFENREDRVDQLAETATWFSDGRTRLLTSASTAQEIRKAPHVTASAADLATRVVPGRHEDPVLAQYGVLRVAARFQGIGVDQQNKLSDGRLAIARMIGGEESSDAAHLALIELANGICGPGRPRCGECPLVDWCHYPRTKGNDYAPTLPGITTPGRGQRQDRADASDAAPSPTRRTRLRR